MTDRAPRRLARRTLAGSAAVLAAAGALSAVRAENGVEQASAATGQVPVNTVPSVRTAAWTATPLATAASAGHRKHKKKAVKHKKKVVKPRAKAKPKPKVTPTPAPVPTPMPTTPTTPTTPSTPVA